MHGDRGNAWDTESESFNPGLFGGSGGHSFRGQLAGRVKSPTEQEVSTLLSNWRALQGEQKVGRGNSVSRKAVCVRFWIKRRVGSLTSRAKS